MRGENEMDERQARRFLAELMSGPGAESGYELRYEDRRTELWRRLLR
jgi:hypothetical protein